MSTVYNPEADIIAEIERLELEARQIRQKVEHVKLPDDKRVLSKQLNELQEQIEQLRKRVP